MLSGFKQFILRGNEVDMAVGVVIGAAFATVVAAFTKDLLTPLIAALVGKLDFSAIKLTMHRGDAPASPTSKKCPECLSEIPIEARRCAHCGQPQGAQAA